MPSVATQTALKNVRITATLGAPRNPIGLPTDWRELQLPSWVEVWCMKHSFSQTEGRVYNAETWDFISAEDQRMDEDCVKSCNSKSFLRVVY